MDLWRTRLDPRKAQLADLYWDSGSVRLEDSPLAAHRSQPGRALSPIYLHYPTEGPGVALLPDIYGLVGRLFYEMVSEVGLTFDYIGAVPRGATPLGAALAAECRRPGDVLQFDKIATPEGTVFVGPTAGLWLSGGITLAIDDHNSSGYNSGRFVTAVRLAGLQVEHLLVVVERQQGGKALLQSLGVRLCSIFTLDELVRYYVATGRLDEAKAEQIRTYVAQNQF